MANRTPREQIRDLLEKSPNFGIYKKKGKVLWRPSEEGETILTIINGELETFKVCKFGEIIIRNFTIGGGAETYVVPRSKFDSRYDTSDPTTHNIDGVRWGVAQAIGIVQAFQYFGDEKIFEAPWGEDMILRSGDWIARPYPADDPLDVYRIEEKQMLVTYNMDENLR